MKAVLFVLFSRASRFLTKTVCKTSLWSMVSELQDLTFERLSCLITAPLLLVYFLYILCVRSHRFAHFKEKCHRTTHECFFFLSKKMVTQGSPRELFEREGPKKNTKCGGFSFFCNAKASSFGPNIQCMKSAVWQPTTSSGAHWQVGHPRDCLVIVAGRGGGGGWWPWLCDMRSRPRAHPPDHIPVLALVVPCFRLKPHWRDRPCRDNKRREEIFSKNKKTDVGKANESTWTTVFLSSFEMSNCSREGSKAWPIGSHCWSECFPTVITHGPWLFLFVLANWIKWRVKKENNKRRWHAWNFLHGVHAANRTGRIWKRKKSYVTVLWNSGDPVTSENQFHCTGLYERTHAQQFFQNRAIDWKSALVRLSHSFVNLGSSVTEFLSAVNLLPTNPRCHLIVPVFFGSMFYKSSGKENFNF